MRCVSIEGLAFGRSFSFPTYRNPNGSLAEQNEYVNPDPNDLFWFSVLK